MSFLHDMPWPLIVLLAIAVVYPIVARILLEFAQSRRRRLVELAEQLIKDGRLTARQREHVRETAMETGDEFFMVFSVIAAPLVVFSTLLWLGDQQQDPEFSELLQMYNDPRYVEMTDHDIFSEVAANPAFAFLFGIELSILALSGALFFLGFTGMRQILLKLSSNFLKLQGRGKGVMLRT